MSTYLPLLNEIVIHVSMSYLCLLYIHDDKVSLTKVIVSPKIIPSIYG